MGYNFKNYFQADSYPTSKQFSLVKLILYQQKWNPGYANKCLISTLSLVTVILLFTFFSGMR